MTRTQLLQELRRMRFKEAYGGWQERRLRTLDRAVLVRRAAVVARDRHAVMGAQRLIALGHVLGFVPAQVGRLQNHAANLRLKLRSVRWCSPAALALPGARGA